MTSAEIDKVKEQPQCRIHNLQFTHVPNKQLALFFSRIQKFVFICETAIK
jgi:hypothetical protein